ncbi:MAG TPA: VWA domain-containing protein [Candidatus Kapabacteria bacterium]|nr:VWA domain-containing protein [Candidatus Kapabacteria bacterium]
MLGFPKILWLAILFLPFALPARGQVVLTLANPVTDSFPLVKIDVNVTQNGAPAALISGTNFSVSEDGSPANVVGLTGCGGTSSAAIALILDTSASMQASLGSGSIKNRSYAAFDDAVSKFIASIPGPSLLALVPFADSSTYWYPERINSFYTSNNSSDTTALMQHVGALQYIGAGTDVVSGIVEGARALQKSSLPRQVMILVTDDAVTNADSVQQFLNGLGIRLFILDVSRDSTQMDYADHDLAIGTGGGYYQAYDTTFYASMLLAMSQLIFAEHCTLEYRSSLPCPAWNVHHVTVTLNYQGTITSAKISYSMDRVPHDSISPRIVLDTPSFISRMLTAIELFPCESGMQSLLDSSSSNFIVVPRVRTADSMSDSLIVTDSLYSADAWILAIDSAGNISRKHILYQPKPDTHPPQFDVPIRTGALYSVDIREMLPWDRGIDTIYLASGAVNLSLDSMRLTNKNFARAFLHIMNSRDSATGCLIAWDSAGNRDTACIEWDGERADTLPPIIVQLPTAEPRFALTGTVTEERLHDRGIQRVVVTPLVNTSGAQIIYDSAQQARVSLILDDSLYAASALIEAWDSAGNSALDTFEYMPLADTHAPLCTYTPIGKSDFVFYATDTQAWDRGVAFMLLLGATTNATAAPARFLDGHRSTLTVNVTDRTLPATILVQVTDSAGYQTTVTVNFAGIPLVPLGDSVIDFGTVMAPASVTRTIMLTNQNDIPVTFDLGALQGDDSVFQIITPSPVLFPAFGTETISFAFQPSLIGSYKATSTIIHGVGVGSVTLLGRSIGTLSLALDTASVQAGDTGSLHLSIESTPKPTNLDTIGFTLTYDPDMVSFADIPSCPSGALDTGLCIYDAYWNGGVAGNRQAILVRNNPDAGATLSFGHASLTLPFQTFVSAHDTTIVHITPLNIASARVISAQDGLVIARNNCGDPTLRSMMTGGKVGFKVLSVNPDPANTLVELNIQSDEEMDANVAFVSLDGTMVKRMSIHLVKGVQTLPLSNLPNGSGVFEVVMSANDRELGRTRIEIVR